MTPGEAAKALLDHLMVPKGHISVWIHRAPKSNLGDNPKLHVAIDPEYKNDRIRIPGQFGDYIVEQQEWSAPIKNNPPDYMLEK